MSDESGKAELELDWEFLEKFKALRWREGHMLWLSRLNTIPQNPHANMREQTSCILYPTAHSSIVNITMLKVSNGGGDGESDGW